MHRIDGAGHVDHLFVAEDPATFRPPTEITPEIMNAFQEELANVVIWALGALDKNDNTQLKQGLLAKFATILSPTLLGNPSAPTPPQFDNDTSLATTEFVQISGHKYSQIAQIAAGPAALNASHCGKLIDLPSAYSGALTLPSANGLVDGAVIKVWSGANVPVTVQRSGTDVIYVNNGATVNSITLVPGDSVEFVRFGAGAWVLTGGSAALAFSGIFGSLFSGNGYQKLPGGLILQWRQGATSVSGEGNAAWPIAFPNALLGVIPGSYPQNGGVHVEAYGGTVSAVTMRTIAIATHALVGSTNYSVFGIGY